jgi:hypothetical protein
VAGEERAQQNKTKQLKIQISFVTGESRTIGRHYPKPGGTRGQAITHKNRNNHRSLERKAHRVD